MPELNAGTVRFVARALMVLITAWSVPATYTMLQSHRSFVLRGQQVCAVLHRAGPSTRSAGTQYKLLNADAAAWSVDARYSYDFSGRTFNSRGVWPWGPQADRPEVIATLRLLSDQQEKRGCVTATVDPADPSRAVLFASSLEQMWRHWLLTPSLLFMALLAVDLIAAWFGRNARQPGAARQLPE